LKMRDSCFWIKNVDLALVGVELAEPVVCGGGDDALAALVVAQPGVARREHQPFELAGLPNLDRYCAH